MLRTMGIWVFGTLASGFIGAILGDALLHQIDYDSGSNEVRGCLAGILLFACLRLWLASPRPQ